MSVGITKENRSSVSSTGGGGGWCAGGALGGLLIRDADSWRTMGGRTHETAVEEPPEFDTLKDTDLCSIEPSKDGGMWIPLRISVVTFDGESRADVGESGKRLWSVNVEEEPDLEMECVASCAASCTRVTLFEASDKVGELRCLLKLSLI